MRKSLIKLLMVGVLVAGAHVAQPSAAFYETCNDVSERCYSQYYTQLGIYNCEGYEAGWLCDYECIYMGSQVLESGQCTL